MAKRGWPHVDNPVAVGQRIREARLNAGLSQRQLAFQGCTAVYICRIEQGQRVPSLQVLRELAHRLNVDEDWLALGIEPDTVREQNLEPLYRFEDETLQALAWLGELPIESLHVIVSLAPWFYPNSETDPTGAIALLFAEAIEKLASRTVPQLNEIIELMEAQDQ